MKKENQTLKRIIPFVLTAGIFLLSTTPAISAEAFKQQVLIDKSRMAIESFLNDPNMDWMQKNFKKAKGLLIIPDFLKAGFIFGGSGGSGVLLVLNEKTGKWSEPAFYTIGGASVGLQIGAEKSEVIMMVMTTRGLESLYSSSFKLGGAASIAAGPVGITAEGATAQNLSADFLSFARSKGAFAGISLEGAVLKVSDKSNKAYYGKPVRPVDIIVKRSVSNPKSAELRAAAAKATK
jgi:lipid-binding SYLF domain-containing protein